MTPKWDHVQVGARRPAAAVYMDVIANLYDKKRTRNTTLPGLVTIDHHELTMRPLGAFQTLRSFTG